MLTSEARSTKTETDRARASWLVNNTPQADNDLRIACIDALLERGEPT